MRSTPRVSVNKLAEYLGARAGRRRAIIIDQKYPPDFKVAYYTAAQNAIVAYLASSTRDERVIVRAIDKLLATKPRSEWDSRRIHVCVDALEAFLGFGPDLELDGVRVIQGATDAADLAIAGVAVSVRPELVLRDSGQRGEARVGAMKLCFSKNSCLGEDGGGYVGAALQRYAELHLSDGCQPSRDLCLVVDIFAKEVHVGPKGLKQRFRDMEAACEEIARAWDAY